MIKQNISIAVCRPFLLIAVLVVIIYANTLNAGWHLDDIPNIVRNPKVHMESLDTDSVISSFYAAPTTERLNRPFSYFTFAVNWYLGKDRITGYHIVNISIHVFAGFFLFLSILLLFQTSRLKGQNSNQIYFIALFTSVLWAIHPIQIQAVTYIVQRMASLAALFYIIGICCYLKARLTRSILKRLAFSGLCIIAFLLGIGSKSNVILLPISLVFIEFIFFRDLTQKKNQKIAAAIILGGGLLIAAIGVFLFIGNSPMKIFTGYESRPFTLSERLLTQPRIILFYLSQIFYPVASRFSIAHNIPYSTSLFHPWTTLPAAAAVFLLIGLAFRQIRKNPILSFAILFYFINHVIESSIIPLEMIFEHRNYLPTLFLFLPISVSIKRAFDYYHSARKPMYCFLVISVILLMTGLGITTYTRNMDWKSEKTLWEDARKKAPDDARPLQNLAWGYYTPTGQYEEAIKLYLRALTKQGSKTGRVEFISYNNMAYIYYSKLNDYEKAVQYAQKAVGIYPDHARASFILCHSLALLGRFDEAKNLLNQMVARNPYNERFIYLKGVLRLQSGNTRAALKDFRQCHRLSPGNWRYHKQIGVCFTSMKQYEKGYWFLKRAYELASNQPTVLLGLTDNRIRAGHISDAEIWVQKLIHIIGADRIDAFLINHSEKKINNNFLYRDISQLISKQLMQLSRRYSETASLMKSHFEPSY